MVELSAAFFDGLDFWCTNFIWVDNDSFNMNDSGHSSHLKVFNSPWTPFTWSSNIKFCEKEFPQKPHIKFLAALYSIKVN